MSWSSIAFAAVQMTSQDDLAANLSKATDLIAQAATAGARVVLLPENFAYMGPEEGRRAIAEPLAGAARGPILTSVARAAAKSAVHVIAGGMPERGPDADHPFNSCVVVAPDGSLVATYRKIHLFDVDIRDGQRYRESASTTPGDRPVFCTIAGACVGLSVCYDLRFPELFRAYVDAGADVIVVPAAFTATTGKDHWDVLLRARAIESQAYVVAAAQWGTHPRGRQTFGSSSIVDPWGDLVGRQADGEGVVVGTIDRARIDEVRRALPALRHRRLATQR